MIIWHTKTQSYQQKYIIYSKDYLLGSALFYFHHAYILIIPPCSE